MSMTSSLLLHQELLHLLLEPLIQLLSLLYAVEYRRNRGRPWWFQVSTFCRGQGTRGSEARSRSPARTPWRGEHQPPSLPRPPGHPNATCHEEVLAAVED